LLYVEYKIYANVSKVAKYYDKTGDHKNHKEVLVTNLELTEH
jgi:hypothetical protein